MNYSSFDDARYHYLEAIKNIDKIIDSLSEMEKSVIRIIIHMENLEKKFSEIIEKST